MSWVGVMIGVGVGAAAGGIQAGLNDGDAGDILKGMALGGAMGGAGGAAGTAITGAIGGAAAGTAGGATTGAAGSAGTQGIGQLAANPLTEVTTSQVVPQTIAPQALSEVATPSWGQSFIGNTFNTPVTGTAAKIGGSALEQGVYGAGIGALGSGVTGQDPLKGAATGMIAGGIGGAAQAGLASQAGATGFLGKAGQFAAEHPVITSGGIGMLAQPMLNGMMSGSETPSPTEQKSQFAWGGPKYAYSPSSYKPYDLSQHRDMFPIYQPSYYAAGGLTDVDGYMSQAQNVNQGMSKGGPSDMGIPNPNEVADPEGYTSNSVQMMARGGVARYGIGGDISKVADLAVSTSLPGQIFGWESASELPIVGGLFNDPSRTASLTPEEKKKLMAAAARNQTVPVQADNNPPQQMARGGIASLGAYSKGGNLLDGPGDGVSDDIPASIENKQPARLARGEYVIPSRIVSELGNGSTDAGAARLDEMVKRIQTGRKKTLKGKDYAKDTKAYKHLPV